MTECPILKTQKKTRSGLLVMFKRNDFTLNMCNCIHLKCEVN